MSKASPTDDEIKDDSYLWIEGGADPYAMTIKNVQASKYVTASATDKSALEWNDNTYKSHLNTKFYLNSFLAKCFSLDFVETLFLSMKYSITLSVVVPSWKLQNSS